MSHPKRAIVLFVPAVKISDRSVKARTASDYESCDISSGREWSYPSFRLASDDVTTQPDLARRHDTIPPASMVLRYSRVFRCGSSRNKPIEDLARPPACASK